MIIHATRREKGEVGTTTLLYHEEECIQHKYLGYEWVGTFYFSMLLYTKYLDSCGVVGGKRFKKHFLPKGLLC